jgi:hypothetical protein
MGSLSGSIADWTLQNLLQVMKYALIVSDDPLLAPIVGLKGYSANIHGFNAVYGFESNDKTVNAAAVFKGGKMHVEENMPDKWDLKVAFKDAQAFWDFIFSGGQDILKPILDNNVEVYGNLNYLYKFGFMARDLKDRLGLSWSLSSSLPS